MAPGSEPWRPLLCVGALYAIQGMVSGFASYVLVPQLSLQGVSLTAQTGIVALAGLPWVLKLLWAPLVDGARFGARPLAVARVASWVTGVCLAAAGLAMPGGAVQALAWLWLLTNISLSLLDVATDAFVIDTFDENRRGLANGVLLGGRDVGTHIIGGLVLGAVVGRSGLVDGMVVAGLGVAALGVMTLVFFPRDSARRASFDPQALLALFRRPRSLVIGGLGAMALAADIGTSAVTGDFLVQRLGWTLQRITTELPLWSGAASLVGYAIASASVDRLRPATATWVGAAGLGVVWVVFSRLETVWTHDGVLPTVIVAQVLPTALLYAGLYAWLMNATEPRVRATHFAVLMALLNVPRLFAPPLVAQVVGSSGYADAYLTAGLFELLMAAVVFVAVRWIRGDQS